MTEGPRVRVVGGGYVGLVTAVGLVSRGHAVELLETRSDRRDAIRAGRPPLFEAGVQEILGRAVSSGVLVVRSEQGDRDADVTIVCVGTPIHDDGSSDLSQLRSALSECRRSLRPDETLVIRSTTPIGGARKLVDEVGLPADQVLVNPEFLRQGTALNDFLAPTRVVIGSHGPEMTPLTEGVRTVLHFTDAPRLDVTYEEAELIKNAANAFLALKLSFVNELALLSEAFDGDIANVVAGLALDPRIGGAFLRPSFGFGGSCLPKEMRALATAGRAHGLAMHVTNAAAAANTSTQAHFASRIEQALDGVAGRTVAILGLSFKAGTDDIRESPAVAIASRLHDRRALLRGYDPEAGANARAAAPWLDVADSAAAAIDGADAVVIATEWPEFADLDWASMRTAMRRPLVIDGRRLLDPRTMRALGYEYVAVGTARHDGVDATVSTLQTR